ncbi:MAG: helix-turn-helix transcriptional regulator [Actinobacteria bacterium]|nr:helix-turn-helix transcriptional regulator [Actinomycetota bacterium]
MSEVVRSTAGWEIEIGHRIRAVRRQYGMTQQELADRANISRSTVKYLESGAGSSLATFINVVRALELDEVFDQIFGQVSTVSPLAVIESKQRSATK